MVAVSLMLMLEEMADALAEIRDELPDLQVHPFWDDEPTPPVIDMYPGSPFQDGPSFGLDGNRIYWTVRARVGTADSVAAQQLLLRLLDVTDQASVEAALWTIDWAVVPEGVSGFTTYGDDSNASERMLGCEWRVTRYQ